jgi:hypothetical protein
MSRKILIEKPSTVAKITSWDTATPTVKEKFGYPNGAQIEYDPHLDLLRISSNDSRADWRIKFSELDNVYGTTNLEEFTDYLLDNNFFSSATGGSVAQNRYANVAAMFADQGGQTDGYFQFVTDASGDASVDTGYAYYEYLGTTNGNITDYRKVSDQESLDGPVPKPIENRYATVVTMFADQANQTDAHVQRVTDASGDATVDSGHAYYEYLGTTNGNITDYRKLSEEESMDDFVDDSVTIAKLAPKFKGRSEITGTEVDWDEDAVRYKTLGGNTVLTFANLYEGVKQLEVDGAFTFGLPAQFKEIDGSKAFDGSVMNFIEVVCTDAVTPAGWFVISQETP